MKMLIKNMVCDHCVRVIKNVLTELALDASSVHMGEVDFGNTTISIEQLQQFKHKIELLGFELINDKKTKLIENIKKPIIKLVQQETIPKKFKLSKYFADKLHHGYTQLSCTWRYAPSNLSRNKYISRRKIL